MKDKILEKLRKISVITNEPDADWRRVFAILLALTCFSLGWSVYFFFGVKADMEATNRSVSGSLTHPLSEKENELKTVIDVYEKKKAEHNSLRGQRSTLGDPSVF